MFMVVAASGHPGWVIMRKALRGYRDVYPDASIKRILLAEDGCGY